MDLNNELMMERIKKNPELYFELYLTQLVPHSKQSQLRL